MNRRRERRWQSSQDRARVAAELIEEAESLTETGAIASPLDVARDKLPPPLRVASKAPEAPEAPRSMRRSEMLGGAVVMRSGEAQGTPTCGDCTPSTR